MAEINRYPQIPSNVWWGLRALLKKRPTIKVDDMLLASDLGVQIVAARQYLQELKRAKILDDEGRPTEVANKWRHDDTYPEAVDIIVSEIYPDSLRLTAPPGEATRAKVVNWFSLQGLGTGAAGNKAATYLMISSQEPLDLSAGTASKPKSTPASSRDSATKKPAKPLTDAGGKKKTQERREISMPLNINVQVHISADASNDQIEAIFKSMRRYLYDDQTS